MVTEDRLICLMVPGHGLFSYFYSMLILETSLYVGEICDSQT